MSLRQKMLLSRKAKSKVRLKLTILKDNYAKSKTK